MYNWILANFTPEDRPYVQDVTNPGAPLDTHSKQLYRNGNMSKDYKTCYDGINSFMRTKPSDGWVSAFDPDGVSRNYKRIDYDMPDQCHSCDQVVP